MRRISTWVAAGMLAMPPAVIAAQSPDERVAAREVVKKRSDAVVIVLATLRLRVNLNGTEQPSEQPVQANGTVIDPSGLTVVSLTSLQPDDALARRIQSTRPNQKVDVSSEASDIRIRLADGRELPAKLVLKDDDLDLAFLRPSEAPAAPLVAMDTAAIKPGILDLLVVMQRTSEATGWQVAAGFSTVQLVIDKPRTYYVLNTSISTGSPVLDVTGRFVGISLVRTTGARGTGSPGILPADDIREIAKQAK